MCNQIWNFTVSSWHDYKNSFWCVWMMTGFCCLPVGLSSDECLPAFSHDTTYLCGSKWLLGGPFVQMNINELKQQDEALHNAAYKCFFSYWLFFSYRTNISQSLLQQDTTLLRNNQKHKYREYGKTSLTHLFHSLYFASSTARETHTHTYTHTHRNITYFSVNWDFR